MEEKKKTKEIDVLGLIGQVLREKKLLLKFCAVFAVIGVVVALNNPRYYTTTITLAPEAGGASGLGSLGTVASMFDINLNAGGGEDAIYPELYPEVFASNDFMLQFLKVPVHLLEDSARRTYEHHLIYDAKIPFWEYPGVWLKKGLKKLKKQPLRGSGEPGEVDPFFLTEMQVELCKVMHTQIACMVDKKTDIITISVTDNDPYVSAQMADTVMKSLQNYITDYRTSKARHDMEFMQNMYDQTLESYKESQEKYARMSDAYHDVILARVSSELEELESEMQLKYNMYTTVAQQLQLARQRVQERTPIYKVIQQASVPLKPSSTPKLIILIAFCFLGVLADAAWVLWLRNWWKGRHKVKGA